MEEATGEVGRRVADRSRPGLVDKFDSADRAPSEVQWLTDRIRELETEAENRDEALALIAHELRTPLTVLQGGIWFLRHQKDEDEATRDELLATLDQQARFLSLALVNMLTLARVGGGDSPEMEPLVLREEIRGAVEAFHGIRENRDVKVDVRENLPPVLASSGYVQEMLVNLLVNADRYSPRNEAVTITATEHKRKKSVWVSVADEGEGLPEEELGLIFDRFYQSSRRTGSGSGTGTGTGLGLTVCRRLAEAQNGEIWARNIPGHGLDVTFSLESCPVD